MVFLYLLIGAAGAYVLYLYNATVRREVDKIIGKKEKA
jgi:uncharacterized membrane protein YuzA (DUF378 family)